MNENANAHDADDCPVDCMHPDHYYLGDDPVDLGLLLAVRELAGSWSYLEIREAIEHLDPEGPVVL